MKIIENPVQIGGWHEITLTGPIVGVGELTDNGITVSSVHREGSPAETIRMRAVAVDEEIELPNGYGFVHVGRCSFQISDVGPPLVWHLVAEVGPVGCAEALIGHVGVIVQPGEMQ